ncbi:MAG: protein kinase [Bacteroidales bacterium]|nr:protein kinase [Bacteroidales bacterium]MCD8394140.1 protein kinase [Bacteroidales bacterium]
MDEGIMIFRNVQEFPPQGCFRIARAQSGNRWYYLKGLRPEVVDDFDHLSLLQQEFDLLTRLNHPGIPTLMTIQETSPIGPCLVLDMFEGMALPRFLAQGKRRADRRTVGEGVISALAYLHNHDMYHGDLRPENICVSQIGYHPWILNFAIDDNDAYTQYASRRATDEFTPPELQASPRLAADARCDIYAFGQLLKKLHLGWRYNGIIKKCTRKDPDRRFQSADEVSKAMTQGTLGRHATQIIILMIALIAALLVIILTWRTALPARNAINF